MGIIPDVNPKPAPIIPPADYEYDEEEDWE